MGREFRERGNTRNKLEHSAAVRAQQKGGSTKEEQTVYETTRAATGFIHKTDRIKGENKRNSGAARECALSFFARGRR